jgi:RecJ-like exonuclease
METKTTKCPTCHGTGDREVQVDVDAFRLTACPRCDGTGEREVYCDECDQGAVYAADGLPLCLAHTLVMIDAGMDPDGELTAMLAAAGLLV